MNPHQVTKDFEKAIGEYTGAPYVVAVNSCTMALLLAVAWHAQKPEHRLGNGQSDLEVEIPKRTYVGVPMSIIHAGGRPTFRDEDWVGKYQLKPLPVWDSAREFTSDMYRAANLCTPGAMVCISMHASKVLGDTQGGAILHDDPEADRWLRMARFDGRQQGVAPKDQQDWIIGHHCYISPDVSARLLWKLSVLPKHNAPLPPDDYPDLSKLEVFR